MMDSKGFARREVVVAGVGLLMAGCSGRAPTTGRRGIHYRVEVGDSLASIARRSGLDIVRICDSNGLRNGRLHEGQLLWLPGVDHIAPAPGRHVHAPPQPCPPPSASTSRVHLISRQQWNAAPLRANHDRMPSINRITVHHTGKIDGMNGHNDLSMVRRIQQMHQDSRGWADIGYHYVIGHDGRVYQGRPETVQGAHVKGDNNKNNLGISVLGDFMQSMPTGAQMQSLHCLVTEKQACLGVPTSRVYGHREFGQTLCPGDRLFAWLERFRRGAV